MDGTPYTGLKTSGAHRELLRTTYRANSRMACSRPALSSSRQGTGRLARGCHNDGPEQTSLYAVAMPVRSPGHL